MSMCAKCGKIEYGEEKLLCDKCRDELIEYIKQQEDFFKHRSSEMANTNSCIWNGMRTCDCHCHDTPEYCEDCMRKNAGVAKLASAADLKSADPKDHEGSSPSSGTIEMLRESEYSLLIHGKAEKPCTCKSCRIAREILLTNIKLNKLIKAHEALLNTLGASNNHWIKMVHKNAAAYYETWKKEYDL